ncbi:MAG: UDP-N-acetylmuramate--L-alanine ligase [Gammaproteobacteria bacterium]|nr:UDP-N-acetylmuramate--L-alanine ligase [Gammaproteobacteria bacterium]
MADTHVTPMRHVRNVHFVGIGGAGMGGIAEVMHNLGYHVTGSDNSENTMVARLRGLGVTVASGHRAEHAQQCDVLVVSSAIGQDNPELEEARKRRIPIVPRAEMLAELMRFRYGIAIAGTHGKTTTTSLVASVLAEGGLDPTYVIGGKLISSATHARLGTGRFLVAEADESDASFLHLQPMLAVLTNIDADHMATYEGRFDLLRKAFIDFLRRLPFYGMACICVDDEQAASVINEVRCQVVTYGTVAEADVRAEDIRSLQGSTFFKVTRGGQPWLDVKLNLPGLHNVLNALAAIVIGHELGASDQAICAALAGFEGIGRRMQRMDDVVLGNARVLVIDDYGHHPREIAAVFSAIRDGWPERRLVVAFQPHRFTRTRDLFDDFASVLSEADELVLTEVYAAGEHPIAGADGRALARAVRVRGQVEPIFVETPDLVLEVLTPVLTDGDILLLLGAGSIGTIAASLAANATVGKGGTA